MDNSGTEKQYGINKIFKFAQKKNGKGEYITDTRALLEIEKKNSATVVKMEFSNNNCFILLSDGRVLSKGREECLGREASFPNGVCKTYGEILFQTSLDEKEGSSKSAIIYNISAGDEHVLALDNNYRVWAWGSNNYLQVHPKQPQNILVKKPIYINMPTEAKGITQIFALQRSSMIICKNNIIYAWGSVSEGFLGDLKDKKGSAVAEFIQMQKLTTFIVNDINKNDENYTETFINSRKLFNTKYNHTLEDNNSKSSRIDKLQQQIDNLKTDIEIRKKQNQDKILSLAAISKDKSDKKILLLKELMDNYERKLNKMSVQKDELRNILIYIEEDINQKNIDLKALTEQIDSVEDKIEIFNNEITELNATFKPDGNSSKDIDIKKKINEKNKHLYNLKIYKESLMSNLQLIIVFLEEKEKERKGIADQLSKKTNKENQYLKNRYIVEDMIMILFESLNNTGTSSALVSTNNSNSYEKFKEKYIELFSFNDKLEKITFSELNKTFPYKITEDILDNSNRELNEINRTLEIAKSTLSESVKDNLATLFTMIESKMELIREQNIVIKNIYSMFTNLQHEVKIWVSEEEKLKNSDGNEVKNNLNNHIEYIYKELITKFLDDAHRTTKQPEVLSADDKERIENEQKNYLVEKQKLIKKLEDRNKLYDEESKFDLKDIVTFEYNNSKTVSKTEGSTFSWMGGKK